MKKQNIKPNLAGILFIVLGVIVIVLAILFFAVDPTRNESAPSTSAIIAI